MFESEIKKPLRKYTILNDELYDYLLSNSLRESNTALRLRRETEKLDQAIMQISPDQGQFMALLIRLLKAKDILEIGTFTGYSTLCMAEALPAKGRLLISPRVKSTVARGSAAK